MQQEETKMGLKIINTRRERELRSGNDKQVRNGGEGGGTSSSTLEDEPVSPTGQYFNSSVLSISVLVVLESQVPIDDSPTMALLRDVFLPINPRFSSIMVVDKNGVKQWKKVEVNLQSHVKTPIFPSNLTPLQYTSIFNDYLTKIALEPLPQTRPLWEIHLIKYPTTNAAGHLIFKLHHALGDGFSLMGALLSCLQRADDPSLPLTFPTFPTVKLATTNEEERFMRTGFFTGFVPRAVSAAYNTMCDFCWSVLKSSVVEDDKSPIRSGGVEVEFQPVSLATIAFQLERVKQIKVELGVTINDVISGVINYGTRLYMRETSKDSTKSHSTALVLMNTRNTGGYKSVAEMLKSDYKESSWGNQFAFLHATIPELMSNNQEENDDDGSCDPLKLVYEARKTIQRKKSSLAVYLTGQTLEIIRKCAGPETAAQFIHNTLKNSSMTISNMVGPVEQMALANHPIKGLYFMVVGVPQSLTITVLSYTKTLRIAVGAEKGHIDVNKFVSCIEKAFDTIFNAAIKSNI